MLPIEKLLHKPDETELAAERVIHERRKKQAKEDFLKRYEEAASNSIHPWTRHWEWAALNRPARLSLEAQGVQVTVFADNAVRDDQSHWSFDGRVLITILEGGSKPMIRTLCADKASCDVLSKIVGVEGSPSLASEPYVIYSTSPDTKMNYDLNQRFLNVLGPTRTEVRSR